MKFVQLPLKNIRRELVQGIHNNNYSYLSKLKYWLTDSYKTLNFFVTNSISSVYTDIAQYFDLTLDHSPI